MRSRHAALEDAIGRGTAKCNFIVHNVEWTIGGGGGDCTVTTHGNGTTGGCGLQDVRQGCFIGLTGTGRGCALCGWICHGCLRTGVSGPSLVTGARESSSQHLMIRAHTVGARVGVAGFNIAEQIENRHQAEEPEECIEKVDEEIKLLRGGRLGEK